MNLDRLCSTFYYSILSSRKLINRSQLSSSRPHDRVGAILKNISKSALGEIFYQVGGVRQGQQKLSNIDI